MSSIKSHLSNLSFYDSRKEGSQVCIVVWYLKSKFTCRHLINFLVVKNFIALAAAEKYNSVTYVTIKVPPSIQQFLRSI